MTENALAPTAASAAEIMEQVIVKGDLAKLSAEERSTYYLRVCESIGLNPLTRPFEYITLNGKLLLYAGKGTTDQLRSLRGVSIGRVEAQLLDDVYVVTVYARSKDGREDSDIGAVPLARLQGEARANAMMKAVTKAKRRVTLSICGLGMLDESEVDSIPGAVFGESSAAHEPQSLAVEFDQNFDAAASHPQGGRYPQASPDKPAAPNQLATIDKLCRLLNEPVGVPEGASSAQASERITELSRIYNERKGKKG